VCVCVCVRVCVCVCRWEAVCVSVQWLWATFRQQFWPQETLTRSHDRQTVLLPRRRLRQVLYTPELTAQTHQDAPRLWGAHTAPWLWPPWRWEIQWEIPHLITLTQDLHHGSITPWVSRPLPGHWQVPLQWRHNDDVISALDDASAVPSSPLQRGPVLGAVPSAAGTPAGRQLGHVARTASRAQRPDVLIGRYRPTGWSKKARPLRLKAQIFACRHLQNARTCMINFMNSQQMYSEYNGVEIGQKSLKFVRAF